MQILAFDLKSSIAHFRMPDTLNTHATYPFIPPITLRGLVGSILGLPEFAGQATAGLKLLNPVRKTTQQISMLGKGWMGSGEFNRPTTVELVVQPHYRVYWNGDYFEELRDLLQQGRSTYHTYLGSAFALTFPRYVDTYNARLLDVKTTGSIECSTVVPIDSIKQLIPVPDTQYSRVGGLHYEYHGNRNFGKTRSVLYEPLGKPIYLKPGATSEQGPVQFCELTTGEVVCLW